MQEQPSCVDVTVLRAFVSGKLGDAEAASLEGHLLQCDRCAEAINTIVAGDTLLQVIRSEQALVTEPESERLRDLIERLGRMRPAAPTYDVTVGTDGASLERTEVPTPVPSTVPDVTAELHDFLSPPREPGDLGSLGSYRVLRVLGAGGMGVVFEAEDPSLQRRVALKAMRPALAASASARERFVREARATAALRHDHIVTIYQVGEDRGIPFLAMELLEGETLDDRLERGKAGEVLPLAEVLRIAREVARGLGAAHKRGLIHRDIKPGNIWLEAETGRVKVLDFGLVREGRGKSITQQGTILGTPAYMAPEQARGQELDHRCDLFSLGCVLYRMLTGRTAFRGEDPISTLLSVANDQPAPPHELNPSVPAPLSALVMRLLSKSPQDRPGSVQKVLDALEAVAIALPAQSEKTQDSPARTVPPASVPRRLVLAGMLLIALVPLAWFVVAGWIGHEISDRPVVPEKSPPVVDSSPMDALDPSRIPVAERILGKDLVAVLGEHRQRHWGAVFALAIRPDGKQAATCGRDQCIRFWDLTTRSEQSVFRLSLPTKALAYSPDGKRGVCQNLLFELTAPLPKQLLTLPVPDEVHGVAFSPDGKALTMWYRDPGLADNGTSVLLWDLEKSPPGQNGRYPGCESPAFSPDGKALALVHRNTQSVVLESPGSPEKPRVIFPGKEGKLALTPAGWLAAPVFAPDGRLATIDPEKVLRLWDISGEKPRIVLTQKLEGTRIAFSADGRRVVTDAPPFEFQLWTREQGQASLKAGPRVKHYEHEAGDLSALGLTPDGQALVTTHLNGAVRFWDIDEQKVREHVLLSAPTASTACGLLSASPLVVCPDRRTLALRAGDSRLTMWDLGGTSPQKVPLLEKATERSWPLAYTADGLMFVSVSEPLTVRLWGVSQGFATEGASFQASGKVHSAAFSPDSQRLVLGGEKTLSLWGLTGETPKEITTVTTQAEKVTFLAFTPDGRTLWSGADRSGELRRWEVTANGLKERELVRDEAGFHSRALSPDGRTLAVSLPDRRIVLWEVGEGKGKVLTAEAPVTALAFTPDGRMLFSSDSDGRVSEWDLAGGRKIREANWPGPVVAMAFAGDGRHLITANSNGTVYVVRMAPPRELTDADIPEAARVGGKYGKLLRRLYVPQDAATYNKLSDFGPFNGNSWAGYTGLPLGYWVYSYPHWYIWGEKNGIPLSAQP